MEQHAPGGRRTDSMPTQPQHMLIHIIVECYAVNEEDAQDNSMEAEAQTTIERKHSRMT